MAVVDRFSAKNHFGTNELTDEHMADKDFRRKVFEDIMKLCETTKLNKLERPKQMQLILEPFSVDNQVLTPTSKIKRNVARVYFKDSVSKMYKDGPFE